jgi:hypothetical protein
MPQPTGAPAGGAGEGAGGAKGARVWLGSAGAWGTWEGGSASGP